MAGASGRRARADAAAFARQAGGAVGAGGGAFGGGAEAAAEGPDGYALGRGPPGTAGDRRHIACG
eukprot:5727339-Prymnesium_polylepis.1